MIQVKHRCAVRWQRQDNHASWLEHVEAEHGAIVREFGLESCPEESHPQRGKCAGANHYRRMPTEGTPARRAAKTPAVHVAKDGTRYTPQPLPLDQPAGDVA